MQIVELVKQISFCASCKNRCAKLLTACPPEHENDCYLLLASGADTRDIEQHFFKYPKGINCPYYVKGQ